MTASGIFAIAQFENDHSNANYPKAKGDAPDIDTWAFVVQHVPDVGIGKPMKRAYRGQSAGTDLGNIILQLLAKAKIQSSASVRTDFDTFPGNMAGAVFKVPSSGGTYPRDEPPLSELDGG